MKRQEPAVSSESGVPAAGSGSPAVVCVVPPARRSPAEPPVFSSPRLSAPSMASQPSPARLSAPSGPTPASAPLPHGLPAAGGQGAPPPPLPQQSAASHVVHGIMSYQQAPLPAGHPAHPAHAAYGENLSVKSDGGGGPAPYPAGGGGGGATAAAAAAAGTTPHSTAPQVSHSLSPPANVCGDFNSHSWTHARCLLYARMQEHATIQHNVDCVVGKVFRLLRCLLGLFSKP